MITAECWKECWKAPASVDRLRQNGGESSWHVQASCFEPGASGRYIAGHFYLTGTGGALFGWSHGARTPGRALRRIRRYLQRNPVAFA